MLELVNFSGAPIDMESCKGPIQRILNPKPQTLFWRGLRGAVTIALATNLRFLLLRILLPLFLTVFVCGPSCLGHLWYKKTSSKPYIPPYTLNPNQAALSPKAWRHRAGLLKPCTVRSTHVKHRLHSLKRFIGAYIGFRVWSPNSLKGVI